MRLARFGFGAAVIGSTTYEEAPSRIRPWIRQRTRWFKGWMQTWLVHMRHPMWLARELGLGGFLTFQLVVGGTVLSAFAHLPFIAMFGYAVLTGNPFSVGADLADTMLAALCGGGLVAGYLTSAALGLLGLKRRGLSRHGLVLLLMPLHWLLLSVAAWRALWQLFGDPFRWEKTAHGLARTSRLAAQTGVARTILLRSSGAARPPRPRAVFSG